MSFGVNGEEASNQGTGQRKIVKAVTRETIVALVIVAGIFAVFTWKMGLAFSFKTAMGTAHDLILNTVLFLYWGAFGWSVWACLELPRFSGQVNAFGGRVEEVPPFVAHG